MWFGVIIGMICLCGVLLCYLQWKEENKECDRFEELKNRVDRLYYLLEIGPGGLCDEKKEED